MFNEYDDIKEIPNDTSSAAPDILVCLSCVGSWYAGELGNPHLDRH
jgi:hypothetical protein